MLTQLRDVEHNANTALVSNTSGFYSPELSTFRGQFHRAAEQRKLLTRNICLADFLGYQPNLHVKLMYFGW